MNKIINRAIIRLEYETRQKLQKVIVNSKKILMISVFGYLYYFCCCLLFLFLQNLCVFGKCLSSSNVFSSISYHFATVWWIKSYSFTPSTAFSLSHFDKCTMLEFDILFRTTVFQSLVIKIFCAVENVFVRRQFIQSL